MKHLFAPHLIDAYKYGHKRFYPEGIQYVTSNLTPRFTHLAKMMSKEWDGKIVVFGVDAVCQWLFRDLWNDTFFDMPKDVVVEKYRRRVDGVIGKGLVPTKHIEDLHDLGYLPIEIKALPEGSRVNPGVPVLTIRNTHPDYAWLVNYCEDMISVELWKTMTNATIASVFRTVLEKYADETGSPRFLVPIQGHDFSLRGMSGVMDASSSGAGHLLSFIGTDNIPAIDYLEEYYVVNSDDVVGVSVNATEHSVTSSNIIRLANTQYAGDPDALEKAEKDTIKRLITENDTGIFSYVSDTFDYWRVVTKIIPELKDVILARKPDAIGLSKVVIRPDSGDPVRMVVGYFPEEYDVGSDGKLYCCETGKVLTEEEVKGSLECLWEAFGGQINEKGFKVLHPAIGMIYGDSINITRMTEILSYMKKKGFASCNMVFGIGSGTYQGGL